MDVSAARKQFRGSHSTASFNQHSGANLLSRGERVLSRFVPDSHVLRRDGNISHLKPGARSLGKGRVPGFRQDFYGTAGLGTLS